jgi:hypothetical protein
LKKIPEFQSNTFVRDLTWSEMPWFNIHFYISKVPQLFRGL